jgi:hypothetical protein
MQVLNRDAVVHSHAFDPGPPDALRQALLAQNDDRQGLVFEWQPADGDGHPRLVSDEAAPSRRRRPVLTGVVAALIALCAWNYLVVAQAERWAQDRAYAAARESFGATTADLAALSAAEQRFATARGASSAGSHDIAASEEARSRAESRIRSARETYAQAGRTAASRTVDRTAFLTSSPEWFAYLGALWLVALLPAAAVVGALFPGRQSRALQMERSTVE